MSTKETGTHSFNIEDVSKYGSIEKAIIMKELVGMALYKIRTGGDGWVYYSSNALAEKFPYMSPKSIARWMLELENDGYLLSDNTRNKIAWDKTKHYLPAFLNMSDLIAHNEPSTVHNEATIPPHSTSHSHIAGSNARESESSVTEVVRVPLTEAGDERSVSQRKKSETPNAAKVYEIFKSVTGQLPLAWKANKTQLRAAENLWQTRKPETIRAALEFWMQHRDEQYCPQIYTPKDLDEKWTKLGTYKKKISGV